MSEPRIEIVSPCEHGYAQEHEKWDRYGSNVQFAVPAGPCPGGSRVVYTREEAKEYVNTKLGHTYGIEVVDALLGVGE